MSTEAEGTFEVEGASLYTKTWTPTSPVRAKLILVHGFNEHVNCYNSFVPHLAAQGIQVLAWDQRGWGRSTKKPSERGLTGPTSRVIADVAAFIKAQLPSDVPVFVMGHSMGGGEALTLAADSKYKDLVSQVRGWVLDGPFIAFTPGEEPSFIKIALGRLVAKLLPKQQLEHVVPPEHLSRDANVVEAVRNDPLCHNTGTLEGLASLLDRTGALASGRVNVDKHVQSLFLGHGSDDKICSHDAAKKWLERQDAVEDKQFKSYLGGYHQLHADDCRDEFAKDVVDWILARCEDNIPAQAKL